MRHPIAIYFWYRYSERSKDTGKKAKDLINLHIHSGHIQFISCTASEEIALEWAFYDYKNKDERTKELRIIKIYISRIPTETRNMMINLDNEEVRNHFLSGKPQKDWANGAEEVLFQFKIPKKNSSHENVFELLENAQKPHNLKKKS